MKWCTLTAKRKKREVLGLPPPRWLRGRGPSWQSKLEPQTGGSKGLEGETNGFWPPRKSAHTFAACLGRRQLFAHSYMADKDLMRRSTVTVSLPPLLMYSSSSSWWYLRLASDLQ